VTPLDSFRMRVYIAPFGLWLTLDSGEFQGLEIDPKTHRVRIEFAAATQFTAVARLRVEQPFKAAGIGPFRPSRPLQLERGAYSVPLGPGATTVELIQGRD